MVHDGLHQAKSIEVNATLLDEVNAVIAEDTTLENEKNH